MKILKRILIGVVIAITLALIAGFLFLNHLKNTPLPDYESNSQLPGLISEVTIFRDSFAIPHIRAKNEIDLYRAVGYTMAQDRFWQMDLLRRVTQGKLSEILGQDQLNTDLLMRSLRIQQKSEKMLAQSSPEIKEILEAFSGGVNFYMQNNPLPPEFRILGYEPEPWEPVHSINLIGYMSWDLTSGWGIEVLLNNIKNEIGGQYISDLIPDMKNHPFAVYPEFEKIEINPGNLILSANQNLEKLGVQVFQGSNNWAVSGAKSKSGKPLLANDMHLGLFAPGIWYQMHHFAENGVNVTGLVLPGQPFVICGHNDSIAWGMTNVMVDDLDFYAETLNEDSTKYLLDGEWKNLQFQEEILQTKEGEEVRETLRFTHRGPIVNRFKSKAEKALSIRWIGNEMSNEIRTVYLLNRASNWSDFRDATTSFNSISQNIVFADVKGNIGLQCAAGIPIREGTGIEIYPGDTSLYDWKGLVPYEDLPFEFNPKRGYVSSANNKTVSWDYPYYISRWFSTPNRIERIREMLEAKEKHGIEDFKNMHSDFKSKKAEIITPFFLSVLTSFSEWNETEKAAIEKLQNWNYEMDKESQAAAVFEILYRKVAENMVKDELSTELFRALKGQRILLENLMLNVLPEKKSVWIDDINTEGKETFENVVVQSFKETVGELTERIGPDFEKWKWGSLHKFTISHPLGVVSALDKAFGLNRGPFEMSGSYHTVCPYSYSYNNLYEVNHGASHRHIFDLSDWDASQTVIPTGTSGIPSSDFYLDQTPLYLDNRYHSDYFNNANVENEARFIMKLLPEKKQPD
jgi:penicillin amidase